MELLEKIESFDEDESLELFDFTNYDQFEIPYIALEVGKVAKLEDFYVEIISRP